MEDAKTPTLDLGELRTELGSIKGVGEKRLDEIMSVIEKYLMSPQKTNIHRNIDKTGKI